MIDKIKLKDSLLDYFDTVNYDILDLAKRIGYSTNFTAYQYRLMNMVNTLGILIQPIYGYPITRELNNAIAGLFTGILQAHYLIENNLDITPLSNKIINGPISDLDAALSQLNVDWRGGIIKTLLTNIWEGWLSESRAQTAGDTNKVTQAFMDSKKNTDAFIDTFYNGMLKQFPNLFT